MGYESKNRNPRRRKRTIAARHRGGGQKMVADIDQIRLRPLIRDTNTALPDNFWWTWRGYRIERKMKTEPVTRNCNSIKSINHQTALLFSLTDTSRVDLLTLDFVKSILFSLFWKHIESRISSFETKEIVYHGFSRTHQSDKIDIYHVFY